LPIPRDDGGLKGGDGISIRLDSHMADGRQELPSVPQNHCFYLAYRITGQYFGDDVEEVCTAEHVLQKTDGTINRKNNFLPSTHLPHFDPQRSSAVA